MNNKGFTLIELLGVIVILAVIMSVTAYSVINVLKNSKEKSYDILVDNIKISVQQYFEECENSNILGGSSISTCDTIRTYGDNCEADKCATVSLETLLKYGFLSSSATDSSGNKIIENPKTNDNINDCLVEIRKFVDESDEYVTRYEFDTSSTNSSCPTF